MTSITPELIGRLLVTLIVLSLLMAPATIAGFGVASAQSSDETVTYSQSVEEMRAQLQVSAELVEAGDRETAVEFAERPLGEHWSIVGHRLAAANETLAGELETALERTPERAKNATTSEYATFVQEELLPLLNDAETEIVADEQLANETYNAAVVSGLLERSVAEYHEGVSASGSVTDEEEYLAARSFARQAEQRYETAVAAQLSEHSAAELDELFESLDAEMNARSAPAEVESLRTSIVAELAEYTGLEAEVGDAGSEVIERIESDLDEATEAYEAGNPEEAKSIIRSTYLSNFEGIEGTLIQERPELVEELERDFNQGLPALIEENASVEAVDTKVEEMEGKLDEAAAILETVETDEPITLTEANDSPTEPTEDSDGTTTATTGAMTEPTETTTPGFGPIVGLLAVAIAAVLGAKRSDR